MNIRRLVLLSVAAISLSACGSLPSAMTANLASDGSGILSTMSVDGEATSADAAGFRGRGGKGHGGPGGERGGQMGGKGHGGPGGGFGFVNPQMLAKLNLTDEQKTQLDALQTEAKTFFEANKPDAAQIDSTDHQAQHEAARTALETAFKSDSFDADALAATLEANRPVRPEPSAAVKEFQANQIVKLHGILTADQRAILAAGPDQANKPANFPSPPADLADRQTQMLDQLATKLSLSDDQKTQIKAIFDAKATERQSAMKERQTQMEAQRTAWAAIWVKSSISASDVTALIQKTDDAKPADQHLQELEQIHAILNADQRASFLSLNQFALGGPGGGPGGKGGPGGERGFGGGGRGGHGFGGHDMAPPALDTTTVQ